MYWSRSRGNCPQTHSMHGMAVGIHDSGCFFCASHHFGILAVSFPNRYRSPFVVLDLRQEVIEGECLCMHKVIKPNILYFGTPVVLISTRNEDGSTNLAPMSSAWWLNDSCMLGMSERSQTVQNLLRERECVLNLPSENLPRSKCAS